MALRTLTTATALLVVGCFVDNKPVGATANNTGSDTTGSASATTTTSAASLPTGSSDADSTATGSLTSTTGTTTGTTSTTGTTTDDPATTAPVTTDPATTDPPAQCKALGTLGWAVSEPACRECVTAECCDPFESCASMGPCVQAWDCVAGEPCPEKWPQCPGAVESAVPLVAISNCMMGPCAQVCTLPCLPQIAACEAEPDCLDLESCLVACGQTCMNDFKCSSECRIACLAKFPKGLGPLDAKSECQNPSCGG